MTSCECFCVFLSSSELLSADIFHSASGYLKLMLNSSLQQHGCSYLLHQSFYKYFRNLNLKKNYITIFWFNTDHHRNIDPLPDTVDDPKYQYLHDNVQSVVSQTTVTPIPVCSREWTVWYCSIILLHLQILYRQLHATTADKHQSIALWRLCRKKSARISVCEEECDTKKHFSHFHIALAALRCIRYIFLFGHDKYAYQHAS